MTRTGKIARLPHALREDLNLRLQNGETGIKLVEWLNALPDVQSVLHEKFEGRPITEQNLSEWKQGGFQDWLRLQETRDWLEQVREQAGDLADVVDVASAADWLSAFMAVALGRCFQAAVAQGVDNPYKRRLIMNMAHEIGQLRRRDHEAARFRFDQERWKAKQEKERAAAERHSREPVESAACAPAPASPKSAPRRPSPAPVAPASDSVTTEHPPHVLIPPPASLREALRAGASSFLTPQSKSDQIQPNQAQSNPSPNDPQRPPPATAQGAEHISPMSPIGPISPTPEPASIQSPAPNPGSTSLQTQPLHLNPTRSDQIQSHSFASHSVVEIGPP